MLLTLVFISICLFIITQTHYQNLVNTQNIISVHFNYNFTYRKRSIDSMSTDVYSAKLINILIYTQFQLQAHSLVK
jgi:hypothetical protein